MFRKFLPLLMLGAGLFCSAGLHAQSSVAHIKGNAAVGNKVSIENLETNYVREVEVGKNGRFQFRSLPIGTYDVVIRKPDGDIIKSQMVTLRAGATASVRQGPQDALSAGAEQQTGGGGNAHRQRAPKHDADTAQERARAASEPGEGPQPPQKHQ